MQIANCQPNAHQKELGQKPNGILMLPTKIKIILAHLSVCVYVYVCVCCSCFAFGFSHTGTHTLTHTQAHMQLHINGKRWKFSLIITSVREPCIAFSPGKQAGRQLSTPLPLPLPLPLCAATAVSYATHP